MRPGMARCKTEDLEPRAIEDTVSDMAYERILSAGEPGPGRKALLDRRMQEPEVGGRGWRRGHQTPRLPPPVEIVPFPGSLLELTGREHVTWRALSVLHEPEGEALDGPASFLVNG